MPISRVILDIANEAVAWRRDFHAHPELLFEVHRTAAIVADKLRCFGCDRVETGVGRTGVVAEIRGKRGEGRAIGLRADMDALPIEELGNPPYRSTRPGLMHACGHDGHTAILLGAAKYLAATRNFAGSVVLIFQPAEEGGSGGKVMLDDGLLARFPFDEVFGLHNMPGIAVGAFAIRRGPIMAAADNFTIEVEGRGGHAARPQACIDPVIVASHIVTALQTVVSRNVDPLYPAVLSVSSIVGGDAYNIIADRARLLGIVRTLDADVRNVMESRLTLLAERVASAFDAKASVFYQRHYPATVNHLEQTELARRAAERATIEGRAVDGDVAPTMIAEDFAFMLEARPGAYIFLGNGESAGLHAATYDFNDDALPAGIAYWVALVETALASRD
ncbi:M20 aminoacylase family protein [Bradyrhizobium tropiciagri]|uniref:M20 aminoacylase family protein n=1 Tax=Bradyrhizobium tropiciagri TaxID=312253 RepID=UPI00067C5D0E|nr:M20 aminoacylase family protein [Bradyrhizobium tropiciagri]